MNQIGSGLDSSLSYLKSDSNEPLSSTRLPRDIFEAALVLLGGQLNSEVFVKMHPIFRRLKTYFTEQVVRSSNIYARLDEEIQNSIWLVPANSLILPVTGQIKVGDKISKVGEVVWPTVYKAKSD